MELGGLKKALGRKSCLSWVLKDDGSSPELRMKGQSWRKGGRAESCREFSQPASPARGILPGDVQERWVCAPDHGGATVLTNLRPGHGEEPGQGFEQKSGVILLRHKSDHFVTMLRMCGREKKLEAVRRLELRQSQVHMEWVCLRGV